MWLQAGWWLPLGWLALPPADTKWANANLKMTNEHTLNQNLSTKYVITLITNDATYSRTNEKKIVEI